jgi:probable O-glycosylation ligase (exosortase A-associated)
MVAGRARKIKASKMRDLFFLALLPALLYMMARRPFIALGMWIWTAMFFPNAWLYGMASSFRYNLIFTGVAILSYLCLKEKPRVTFGALGALVFLFFLWTTLSTAMTVGIPEVAWELWFRFLKVVALFLFVVLIMDKKLHVDFFVWCVVLSIGFYAGLEALKYVVSGGGHKIAGFTGHVLGDRNELALAFVMTLPLCAYLLGEYGRESKLLKMGLLGLIGLIICAVVGTQSRGGFIAMLGVAGYFFIKSERKILLSILTLVVIVALSSLVSEEWVSRMDTIGEAGDDASFMGRVVAWKMSFILALHNPIFGAGFKALETRTVWGGLAQEFLAYPFFYSAAALPNPIIPKAAHSVFFQVLGEQGFGGLLVYVAMLFTGFRKARQIAVRASKLKAPAWIASCATMLQLVIFAFCLGGAALSFAYFELIFAVFGMLVVIETRILPAAVAAQQRELQEQLAREAAPASAGLSAKV